MNFRDLAELLLLVQNLSKQHRRQIDLLRISFDADAGWNMALQEQSLQRSFELVQKFCRAEEIGEMPSNTSAVWQDQEEVLRCRLQSLGWLEENIRRRLLAFHTDEVWKAGFF